MQRPESSTEKKVYHDIAKGIAQLKRETKRNKGSHLESPSNKSGVNKNTNLEQPGKENPSRKEPKLHPCKKKRCQKKIGGDNFVLTKKSSTPHPDFGAAKGLNANGEHKNQGVSEKHSSGGGGVQRAKSGKESQGEHVTGPTKGTGQPEKPKKKPKGRHTRQTNRKKKMEVILKKNLRGEKGTQAKTQEHRDATKPRKKKHGSQKKSTPEGTKK